LQKKNDVLKGLVEESKLSLEALREDGCSALMIYYDSVKIRQGFAKVLTKLGEEVACKTTGNADSLTSATKKLIGYGVIQLLFYEFSGMWLFCSI
jgi:hypothetical protein